MSLRSLLASGCLGGLLSSALVLAFTKTPTPQTTIETSKPVPAKRMARKSPPPLRRRRTSGVSASVAALRNELEALRQTVAVLSAASSDRREDESVSAPPEPSPEAQAGRIEAGFRALEDARYAEVRDEAWAHRTEAEAARSLAVDGSFVESFECAASLCELRARHDGDQNTQAFRNHLLMTQVAEELGPVRWTTDGEETVAYFLRAGASWPSEDVSTL